MSTLTEPAQQILDHVARYCAEYAIDVHAEESNPVGAVNLTFAPSGVDSEEARLRVERHLPYIRSAILDGGWALIPAGCKPFFGIAVVCRGYRFAIQRTEWLYLQAVRVLDQGIGSEDEYAYAKALGYTWDNKVHGWCLKLLARELGSHRRACEVIGFSVRILDDWYSVQGIMLPDDAETPDPVASIGRSLAALRKSFGGGRPAAMRPCKWCGTPRGARDLRTHLPRCGKNPRVQRLMRRAHLPRTSGSGPKPAG